MKKNILRLLAIVLIVLFPLSSCALRALKPEAESAPETPPVMFSTFEKKLRDLLDESEMFKIEKFETTDFSGEDTHVIRIVNELASEILYSDQSVTLFVYCNADNEVTGTSCMAAAGNNVNISLISRYVYLSLGLSEMDADTFYDTFEFFEDEPVESRQKQESGWRLTVSYSEKYTHFLCYGPSR
jgi:hypothetical protein